MSHLSKKQKEILQDWVKKQTSLPTEFFASNLPAEMYLALKELHYIEAFDNDVEDYVRKQVLKEFM